MPNHRFVTAMVNYCIDTPNTDVARGIRQECLSVDERISECERCGSLFDNQEDGNECDGEMWCNYCIHSAYYWESDGAYHTDPEPEPEDEPARDSYGIPGYHETELDVYNNCTDILGIELETYQNDLSGIARYMEDNCVHLGWKYERDGSLDDTYGVELVAIPYTLADVKDEAKCPWLRLLRWSRNNGGISWNAGLQYGMHISLNGRAMSRGHRARIVRFFNDNPSLCITIAARNSDYARYDTAAVRLSRSYRETDKYCAAANRQGRIEVRIFRGSLNETRFVRNCEFVDAVRVYCQDCGNTTQALSSDSFKAWMQRPENRATYPLLAEMLGVSLRKSTPQTVEV
jgi:hypothetical protein